MRGRQDDTEFFHKTFPVFIWLLRDVTLSIPPEYKDVKEYLLTKVSCNFRSLHHSDSKFTFCCFRFSQSVVKSYSVSRRSVRTAPS